MYLSCHSLHALLSARQGYLPDGTWRPSQQDFLSSTGKLGSVPMPHLHNAVSPMQTLQGDFNFLHLKQTTSCDVNQTNLKPQQCEQNLNQVSVVTQLIQAAPMKMTLDPTGRWKTEVGCQFLEDHTDQQQARTHSPMPSKLHTLFLPAQYNSDE